MLIERTPEILGGTPVITGTRVSVYSILGRLQMARGRYCWTTQDTARRSQAEHGVIGDTETEPSAKAAAARRLTQSRLVCLLRQAITLGQERQRFLAVGSRRNSRHQRSLCSGASVSRKSSHRPKLADGSGRQFVRYSLRRRWWYDGWPVRHGYVEPCTNATPGRHGRIVMEQTPPSARRALAIALTSHRASRTGQRGGSVGMALS